MIKVIAKDLFDRHAGLGDNLPHLYPVIWGQYSDSMQTKLMLVADFATKNGKCDDSWLLRLIRQIEMCFDSNKSHVLSLCEARYRLETSRQQQSENNMEIFYRFEVPMEA